MKLILTALLVISGNMAFSQQKNENSNSEVQSEQKPEIIKVMEVKKVKLKSENKVKSHSSSEGNSVSNTSQPIIKEEEK